MTTDRPVGQENCLAGLTFVFTGEIDGLSREDGQNLVKGYGGRVTTAPSGKTSYVVLGEGAGPKKLETIAKLKIKTVDWPGLCRLIETRPSGASDPAYQAALQKEQAVVRETAKTIGRDDGGGDDLLWTARYAPKSTAEICGNKGNVKKLATWLDGWQKSRQTNFKRPGPDAMGCFRAVLISGPPGIGKTTAAHLCAEEAGYRVVEFNASDTRNKAALEGALGSLVTNRGLGGGQLDRICIVMDEVDGMSGGDRGGVGALNKFIRQTAVPIIAVCNDRSLPKMKPLAGTCFGMTFRRPTALEVRSRLMSVAFKERLKVDAKAIDLVVTEAQSDLRQVLNMMSTWALSAKALSFDEGRAFARASEKNQTHTPWSCYGTLFGPGTWSASSGLSINSKLELYFADHSIMPLFVAENYAAGNFTRAGGSADKAIDLVAAAAESMSFADLIDNKIMRDQAWSLMPAHGMAACVTPAFHCHGGGAFPAFPAWLGKNSTAGRIGREFADLYLHMRTQALVDRTEARLWYSGTLYERMVRPLRSDGAAAAEDVVDVMDGYALLRPHWDTLVELGMGDGREAEAVLKAIPAQAKAAFTRAFNKRRRLDTISVPIIGRSKKAIGDAAAVSGGPAPDLDDVAVEDEGGADGGPDEDEDDAVEDETEAIKKALAVKKPAAAAAKRASTAKAAKSSAAKKGPAPAKAAAKTPAATAASDPTVISRAPRTTKPKKARAVVDVDAESDDEESSIWKRPRKVLVIELE